MVVQQEKLSAFSQLREQGWQVEVYRKGMDFICRKDDKILFLSTNKENSLFSGGIFIGTPEQNDSLAYMLKIRSMKLRENRIGYQFFNLFEEYPDVISFKEVSSLEI